MLIDIVSTRRSLDFVCGVDGSLSIDMKVEVFLLVGVMQRVE
jgi:hypothetical protein